MFDAVVSKALLYAVPLAADIKFLDASVSTILEAVSPSTFTESNTGSAKSKSLSAGVMVLVVAVVIFELSSSIIFVESIALNILKLASLNCWIAAAPEPEAEDPVL